MGILQYKLFWVVVAFILGMLISRGFRQSNSSIRPDVRAQHFTPTPALVRFRDERLEVQLGAKSIQLTSELSARIRRLAAEKKKLPIVKELRDSCEIALIDAKAIADFLVEHNDKG